MRETDVDKHTICQKVAKVAGMGACAAMQVPPPMGDDTMLALM